MIYNTTSTIELELTTMWSASWKFNYYFNEVQLSIIQLDRTNNRSIEKIKIKKMIKSTVLMTIKIKLLFTLSLSTIQLDPITNGSLNQIINFHEARPLPSR